MTLLFGFSLAAPGFPWALVGLGGLTGFAGWLTWRAAFPTPVPLATARHRIATRTLLADDTPSEVRLKRRLGTRAVPYAEYCGLNPDDVRANARMLDLTLAEHLGSKITSTAILWFFLFAATALLGLAGAGIPVGIVFVVALVAALIGFVLPDVLLQRHADARRRDFETALGSYLDLVAIGLAGGMGIESAMHEAAVVGDNWAFAQLDRAVEAANVEGTVIADRLADLGTELRVPVLVELAVNMALAGTDGAKVAETIATRADTLRASQLAFAESRAQAATERMAIPTAMLLFGFVILIGFPALSTILNGF